VLTSPTTTSVSVKVGETFDENTIENGAAVDGIDGTVTSNRPVASAVALNVPAGSPTEMEAPGSSSPQSTLGTSRCKESRCVWVRSFIVRASSSGETATNLKYHAGCSVRRE
jgi:hypothetical protein